MPRNIGMGLSRGEYLMFVDSDDAITKTALEELYTLAKKFDADVVACDNYYFVDENFKTNSVANIKPVSHVNDKKIRTTQTFLVEDLESRLMYFGEVRIMWNAWNKLIRRDLLMEYEITMLDVVAEDVMFTCCLLCVAKKYLCVPNTVYFYRELPQSIVHKPMTMAANLQRWIRSSAEGINFIDKFMENLHLDIKLKYIAFEAMLREFMRTVLPSYNLLPPPVFDEFVRAELEKIDNPRVFTAFLFSRMNVFNLRILRQQQQIQQLQSELRKLKLDTGA